MSQKYLIIHEYIDLDLKKMVGSIQDAINYLTNLEKEYNSKGISNLRIVWEECFDSADIIYITGTRQETDKERDRRLEQEKIKIQREKQIKNEQEKREKQLYLRLKRKYE